MRSSLRLSFSSILPVLLLLLAPSAARALATTTTTLAVSPSGSVAAGTVLTLTATVASSGNPVLQSAVTFYDGATALGTVQMVSTSSGGFTPGTATFKTRSLSIGSHSLSAKYIAISTYGASTSATQSVTVNGPSPSISSLTAATNSATNYSLNTTVTGLGATAPTGNVTFTDTTSSTTLGISPLSATSAGQLALSASLSSDTCPDVIAIADMNGDGINDLVVGNGVYCGPSQPPASVSVLLGTANGTFQPAITTQIQSYSPASIAVDDLNGDGIPDLVIADSGSNQFWVLLGNGNGTFQTAVAYVLYYDPYTVGGQAADHVIIGDFNGDGIPDVLATMQPDPDISSGPGTPPPTPPSSFYLALGNGDGTFQTPVLLNLGLGSVPAVVAADVNGDNHLDLIVSEVNPIVVLLGNGNGTFQSAQPITTGSQDFAALSVGDLNGDGIPDLVASDTNPTVSTDPSAPSIYVFKGKGDGTFTQAYTATMPNPFQSIALLDFNHDGKLDVAGGSASALCVLSGNGNGTLSASPQCAAIPAGVTVQLASGDLRGFGPGDIALAESGPGYPAFGNAFVASATLASANASLPNITAAAGDKVVAAYAGDANFAAGTSNTVTLGNLLPLTIALTYSSSDLALGQSLTLTAALSSTGSTSPTGTVQFYYNNPGPGGTAIGNPVAISGNTATYTINPIPKAGSFSYSAAYSGDALYPATNSNLLASIFIQQGNVTLATPALSPSATVLTGTPVTITGQLTTPFQTPAPTGTVTLYNGIGNQTIGSQTLSGSSPFALSFTVNTAASPLPPFDYTLELLYAGDANWQSANTHSELIVQGTSTTSISYSGSSSVQAGTPITITGHFTLSANPLSASNIGSVALLDNGTVIATNNAVSDGSTVTFTVNTSAQPLAPGSHSFALKFQGTAIWQPSTSSTVPVTVVGNVSTFTVAPDLGTFTNAIVGTAVPFTATLTGPTGAPVPSGTVQFSIDSTPAGSPITLAAGTASYTATTLTAGSHAIAAAYSGDANYNAANSTSTVSIVTKGANTATLALVSASTAAPGSTTTLTGTLSVDSLGPWPTGSITLMDGSATLASSTLTSSPPFNFTFNVNTPSQPLANGPHSLTLVYTGDAHWAPATSGPQSVTINQGATDTTIAASADTIAAGTSVTLTAAISTSLSTPNPSGTVQFYNGGSALGSPVMLVSGTATYTTSSLAAGTHSITAAYSGDATFTSSTSPAITITVQGVALSLSAPSASVAPGGSITETISLSSLGGLNEPSTFACSGLPQGTACTFSPASVTGTGSTTLTLTTTAATAALAPQNLWLPGSGAALAGIVLLLLPNRKRKWAQLVGVVALCLVLIASGCSGGSTTSGGGGGGGGSSSATPAGTYTITITTTTGNGAGAITNTITFQLIVS